MTSIRESIARLLGRETKSQPDEPDPLQAYTFFWMKEARSWNAEKRAQVASELRDLLESSHFEPNLYERRYSLASFGDREHAGASLRALSWVLHGLEQHAEPSIEEES